MGNRLQPRPAVEGGAIRIVIDLQSAQAPGYRERGIGRYALDLALAIARAPRLHEVFVLLNGGLLDTVEPLTALFAPLLPPGHVRTWFGLQPTDAIDPAHDWRRHASELLERRSSPASRPMRCW